MKFSLFSSEDNVTREIMVDFLFEHLDRFRDSKEDINKCLDYVFSTEEGKGGFIFLARENEQLVGIVVMIQTGMSGYIPENFLVYVAVDAKMRGKGIGKKLIEKAISETNGNVALHVEYDNPARRLYERIGFDTKYAEMRYQKRA